MTDHTADFVIYGSPVSPFARKVAAFCIEKGVDFEFESVDIFNPPEWFLEISPMKRIPVLRDRSVAEAGVDGTIPDSSAICGYIEKKHPQTPLYPEAASDYGNALFIEEFADTNLAAAAGLGIFRPLFFSIISGKEPDIARAQETWGGQMPAVLDVLERRLGEAEWFAGPAISIADFAVTTCLMQASLVAQFDLSPWPALAAHFERMTARESIAAPYAKADRFVRKAMPERIELG